MKVIVMAGPSCLLASAALVALAEAPGVDSVRLATEEELAAHEPPVSLGYMPFHELTVHECYAPVLTKPHRSRYNRAANKPYPNAYRK